MFFYLFQIADKDQIPSRSYYREHYQASWRIHYWKYNWHHRPSI